MKRIASLFLFTILILYFQPVIASEVVAESKITEVTVYPNFVMLNRTANLKLSTGEYQVVFSGIIPELDENSLKVSCQGSAQVKLFGAKLKKDFIKEEPSARVEQLKKEIEKLQDEIKQINNAKAILSEEKNYLDSIRLFSRDQIPKDLVTKMPPAKDLDETLKFLDLRLKENYAAMIDNELKEREVNKKLEVLRRELAQISNFGEKLKRSIVVDLQVVKEGGLDLNISYLVGNAWWQPIYDARANFEKSEVELASYGIVKQNTGEDWQDVELSLSTAKPAVGGRMPEVLPWLLRPYQPPRIPKQSLEASVMMSRKSKMEDYNYNERPEEMALGGEAEPEYAQAEEKGIAVVYKLPRRATVKADGSEHKLPISSQLLKADFQYSTFPRASPSCYLMSKVSNAKDLQLLAGRVNIFLEGDFVGTSSIDNIGPSEEFDLYLGLDENVKVKRELIEKKVDDVLIANIPAPNRRITFRYKTTLENYKNKKIKVALFEAMPASQDERIKVKIEKISLEPKEKDWKDRKGIWRWELGLEPKAKEEIFYTFIVEYPRDIQVEGL